MTVLIGTAAGAFDSDGAVLIDGTRINHLARSDDGWWAVDGKGRIHLDGEVIASSTDGIALNCIQPSHDTVFVGSTEARLFRLEDGRLVESEFFADAPGRDRWYTPWGGPADVRSMAVDLDGALYINIHVGGILRYDNTGISPTIDLEADVHQVVAHPTRQGVVLAATAYGLAESHNGHDFDTRSQGLFSSYCRAVAVLEDTVFVSASNGPRASEGRLYRTDFGGSTMEQLTNGLPDSFDSNLDTHRLATVDGSLFVGHGSTVWQSDDLGDAWSEVVSGLPRITCLA
jgi:hypothetical protein